MKKLDRLYIVSLLDGRVFCCEKGVLVVRIGTAYFGIYWPFGEDKNHGKSQ